jgi:hypothetical protein
VSFPTNPVAPYTTMSNSRLVMAVNLPAGRMAFD